MTTAQSIYRRLVEDDLPGSDSIDDFDAQSELDTFLGTPDELKGVGIPDSYQRLTNRLGSRRHIKIDLHTYAENVSFYDGKYVAVRFYATEIIKAYPDGKTIVSAGSYHTSTTMARINDWLDCGWQLCLQRGDWYWYNRINGTGTYKDNFSYPFTNEDIILPNGSLHVQASRKVASLKKRKSDR